MAVPVFGAFLFIDLVFLGANLLKIAEGGWFPIAVAALGILIMASIRRRQDRDHEPVAGPGRSRAALDDDT